MPTVAAWLEGAAPLVSASKEQGLLLLLDGPIDDDARDAVRALATRERLDFVELNAALWGLHSDGVARAAATSWLGRPGETAPDSELCDDAVGDGPGAQQAWLNLTLRWSGDGDDAGAHVLPPDDRPWLRETEVLARLLAEVGRAEPRLVLLRESSRIDAGSLRALRSLLAGRRGVGWVIAFEGPAADDGPLARLAEDIEAASDDLRAAVARATPPSPAAAEAPALPRRGSSVELLDMLSAAPVPLPAAVVGAESLGRYRGAAPRAGWVDLQGVLDAGRARVEGGLLRLIGGWTPSTAPAATGDGDGDNNGDGDGDGDGDNDGDGYGDNDGDNSAPADGAASLVARADAGALGVALKEVLPPGDPLGDRLRAELALTGSASAIAAIAPSQRDLNLACGDAEAALAWAERGSQATQDPAALRALRWLGRPDAALKRAKAAGKSMSAELALEAGLAAIAVGDLDKATKYLTVSAELAAAAGDLPVAAAAHLAIGSAREAGGDFVPAASAMADAARAAEQSGDSAAAGRALAFRALCIAKAGVADRSLKELRLATERASDPSDSSAAAIDVRVLIGAVFREAGNRDKARQALGMAADRAAGHAAVDREAEARLLLARFHLEAVPVRGKERGEALRDGRDAAEQALALARGMGDDSLQAEAESVLGELSYRAEQWDDALRSLGRQQALWKRAGRVRRGLDVSLRRSQVAARREQWDDAFTAANEALQAASRKRIPELVAQSQLARGEALQGLKRSDEALAAFEEAKRLYESLGAEFATHADAAGRRAQRAISGDDG